jgi:hypothetical protein
MHHNTCGILHITAGGAAIIAIPICHEQRSKHFSSAFNDAGVSLTTGNFMLRNFRLIKF